MFLYKAKKHAIRHIRIRVCSVNALYVMMYVYTLTVQVAQ